ncbi:MAG: L,D-transpeptidase family protein [Micromonosporaceae bacterium]|nr:L,D-transpeptidase family protein [Micromonosporaceae bacterium]
MGRGHRSRLALAAFVALATLAGCSTNATWREPGGGDVATPTKPPLTLVFSHDEGEANVSPGKPVTVQAFDGTLETVTLSSNIGEVPGEFNEDRSMWRSLEDLEFGKVYTLSVSGLGADGTPVEETRTFTTVNVKPGYYWNVYLVPHRYFGGELNGGTFGIGQPIVAEFDDAVDRKVAEATLTVTTNPPVEGAWHWMSDTEAHWRPKEYWKPGTTVTVTANILGVPLTSPVGGRTLYGQENKTATFTIGSSKVAKIDNNTKQMEVYVDGQLVKTMPVSLGRENGYRSIDGRWHDWRTPSGVMVVTEKQNPVVMRPDLPKDDPQYYEEVIPLATRITDSGIYVHAAPWSVNDQGVRNVSHGCINVSTPNAQWFYDNFGPGDVVEIVNTGLNVDVRDGLGDWNLSWDDWLAGSAL